MTNSSGVKPRFGADFLFNWLSESADNPAAAIERQLALSVFQRGKPTTEVVALGYSRQDWQLEHQGISATLTFQNFAQREGSTPRQFAAYTLSVTSPAVEQDKPAVGLLRSVNEQSFKYGTNMSCGSESTMQLGNPDVLGQLSAALPKPLIMHRQPVPAAA